MTQRILEAESGHLTNRNGSVATKLDSSREYSARSHRAGGALDGVVTARGGGATARLTPRMPTNLASNRGAGPRVPLGGVGDAANGVGTPRGFRGMKPSPMSVANSVKITPDDMQKVEHKDMLYLTKKLFNLSTLLEQDTVSHDVQYPVFAAC